MLILYIGGPVLIGLVAGYLINRWWAALAASEITAWSHCTCAALIRPTSAMRKKVGSATPV
jgi:hypothetical protein